MKKLTNKTIKSNQGITLIALVVTIIVLLLLAGISISMLTGENGILNRASQAKEETVVEQEKEEIGLVYNGAKTRKLGQEVTAEDLNNEFNANNINAKASGKGKILITFLDSENEYIINENGNIAKTEVEKVTDTNPGGFNGEGTPANPYLIESIEDLVAFATNVNGGEMYDGEYFKLTQSLDFYSDKSYVNKDAIYTYDTSKNGYVTSETGNAIKELCTTEPGFISIGRSGEFDGIFDGNNCTISNLYINIANKVNEGKNKYIGLFGMINMDGEIKNLSVNGKIIVQETANDPSEYGWDWAYNIGGICGQGECGGYTRIINCHNNVDIESYAECSIGGIVAGTGGIIEKCSNNGNITVKGTDTCDIGGITGILGFGLENEILRDCTNNGNINVQVNGSKYIYSTVVGGITGYNNGAKIENSKNYGNAELHTLSGIGTIGGISAYNDTFDPSIATITDCQNYGKVTGISDKSDLYIGGISGYSTKGTVINNYKNEGDLEATATGNIYKNDDVGKVEE